MVRGRGATALSILDYAQRAKRGANRVRNIVRCEVAMMSLDHPRVGVAELGRDDRERYALHREARRVSVPQPMERNGDDPGHRAGGLKGALLIRPSPSVAVCPQQKGDPGDFPAL